MADSPSWLGGNAITWGDGRAQSADTWGDRLPFPVADPPTPMSDLAIPHRMNPLRVWKSQPSLRKVVGFVARNIAAVPMHVYVRVDDTDRQRSVESETLLRQPAPFVTGPRLVHDTIVDWMLYDRWCVVLVDGVLRRIPAGLLDVKADFLGGLTALRVRTVEGLVDVTDATVAYDAGWAGDREGGVSPLTTISDLLTEQARAVQSRREWWDESARISGLLQTDKVLQRQNRERLLESWREYRDTKAGGTPLLEDGVTYQAIARPKPSDADDLVGRQLTDAEVSSTYYIPPELVGARAGNFASIAVFRQMLYGPALGPYMTRYEAAWNARIIPALAPAGGYGEFARDAALAGSFAEQAEVLSRSTGGPWLLRSEARARQNLPYVDGTDELIVPKNVSEGGLASPADTAPNNDPAWGTP